MLAKGSPYKRLVHVSYVSGHKEMICCENVVIRRSLDRSKILDFEFEGCQYKQIYINGSNVCSVFVELNPHYDSPKN